MYGVGDIDWELIDDDSDGDGDGSDEVIDEYEAGSLVEGHFYKEVKARATFVLKRNISSPFTLL